MELKVKFLGWSAGVPVAMLHKETSEKIGIHTQGRILIKTLSKKPKELVAIVDVVENHLVKKTEIALSSEIKKIMKLKKGQKVEISISPIPQSLDYIKKKLKNKSLSEKEIDKIISDVVDNSLSDPETALFVSAMYQQGMNQKETIYLIKAILKTGNMLSFGRKLVVDKHSIGGIPGNRTTPIVVSICAAAGLIFPKSSSRAITSAAGTADVIETITKVDLSISEIKQVVDRAGACMVWGGSLGLVPADAKIIAVENSLNLDPEAQLLASIMAKKLAGGSHYILVDIPHGRTAKVNKKNALKLKRKFEYLGKYFHKKLKVVLTDGSKPIGRYVGPNLEMQEVINLLDPNKPGPEDLREKSIFLAGEILEMSGKAKSGKGEILAKELLCSGKAFKKFKQIVEAQGGKIKKLPQAKFKKEIKVKRTTRVVSMDNKKINALARVAGCPEEKTAGLYLNVKPGETAKKGETLITIYADSKSRLNAAIKYLKKQKPISVK